MAVQGPYYKYRGKTISVAGITGSVDANGYFHANPKSAAQAAKKPPATTTKSTTKPATKVAPIKATRPPVKAGMKLVSKARRFVPKKKTVQAPAPAHLSTTKRASGPALPIYGTDASGNPLDARAGENYPYENGFFIDQNGTAWAGQISPYDGSFHVLEPAFGPGGTGIASDVIFGSTTPLAGHLYSANVPDAANITATSVSTITGDLGVYDTTDAANAAPSAVAGADGGVDGGYGAPAYGADGGYGAPAYGADGGYGAPAYGADGGYGAPAYAPPGYAPSYPPAYAAPAYAPAYGSPAYAPQVPQQDPNALLYAGAAYGAETAAAQVQQPDPLTASVMMGGGLSDPSGMFSGMPGGFDPTTLAAISGGNAAAAYQMALQNGNYDPTGGMVGADGGDGGYDGGDGGQDGGGY